MMKVCVWFRTVDGPWGGGNQFLKALAQWLVANGHEVTDRPRGDEDVVLVNAFNAGAGKRLRPNEVAHVRRQGAYRPWSRLIPQPLSMSLKRKGPAIVHRLDGVAELIRGHRSEADDRQREVNALTDFTIFQSVYCRDSFATTGVHPAASTIIYNGVDGSIFRPAAQRREPGRVLRFIGSSWSSNPRKGFATIAALSLVPDVEVRFAGRWPETIDPQRVIMLGAKASHDLADALRDADAMVHAAENEPCSNAILEALACGLPVLYRDSGGNRELAGDFGVAIGDDLAASAEQLRANYQTLRANVLAQHGRFLIDSAAEKYVEVFERARGSRS
jgi:glycosyltransferase involved in cell wall biosynthesis